MTINERVKLIRKSDKLNQNEKMTMERFGSKLGVGKTAISDVENGRNSVSNQLFTAICREFDVNPDWLRDGSGPMFREKTRNEEISDFVERVLKDEPDSIKSRMLSSLSRLDDNDWIRLAEVAKELAGQSAAKRQQEDDFAAKRQHAHEELDRQLDLEEGAMGGSEVSSAS